MPKRTPMGGGLAFYPDQSAQVFKEEMRADRSKLADFVAAYERIRSEIFLCHIRRWSPGPHAHRNTHPFLRESNGKEYVFAHNGSVSAAREFNFKRFHPLGDTDSERIFCYLMDFIDRYALDLSDEADLSLLEDHLREINGTRDARLNFLLSDGNRLLCYRDAGGYKKLLMLKREPGYMHTDESFNDDEIDFRFTIEKGADERAVILATEALTRERWLFPARGSLTVLENGCVTYPEPYDEEETDSEKVEVYKAPKFLKTENGHTDVISMSPSLRNELGVNLDERVRVTGDDRSLELLVKKTSKDLIGRNPEHRADHPDRHVCLLLKTRKKLGLEETEYRNGHKKFKTKYTPVSIERVN